MAKSSDYEADRRKHVADGSHQNAVNLNSQKMKSLSLRDKYPVNSSGEEGGNSNSPGLLVFEYLEYEQPYSRKPLTDKASLVLEQRMFLMVAKFPLQETKFVMYPPLLPNRL